MASRRDMQDIMGLPASAGPKLPLQKRPKPAPPVKRMTGISREVVALMGERPPPVAIYDEKKAYKARRHTGPAKKWAQIPFYNPARRDDLILRHWRRKAPINLAPEDADVVMEDAYMPIQVQRDYEFSKYNVQVDVPIYDSEQYEAHFKSEDWTKEETDYLFTLVKDYSYRWPAIWDRYDYTPSSSTVDTGITATPPTKTRTMEELKTRFYAIQAVLMTVRTPKENMTADEFSLLETLTNYDAKSETDRKTLAAALLSRSASEVQEEAFLLEELQRITASQARLEAERDEIRNVHDAPHSNSSMSQFASSQALNQLFQQLFAADRSKKRQSAGGVGGRLQINTADLMTPTAAASSHHHRDSITSAGGLPSAGPRKGNTSAHHQPVRTLSPATEKRFGVTSHDRLQSGVSFRSDKFGKLRQAKSQAQTQKMIAALVELGIPDIITLCSQGTLDAFEKMTRHVTKLLDARKVREKEDGELKIQNSMLNMRKKELGIENGNPAEDDEDNKDDSQLGNNNPDGDTEMRDDADEDEEEENHTTRNEDEDEEDEEDADADADADADPDADPDADQDFDTSRLDEDPDADPDDTYDEPTYASDNNDNNNNNNNNNDNDDDDEEEDPDRTVELGDYAPEDEDEEEGAQSRSQSRRRSEGNGQDEDDEDADEDADADGDTETNGITRASSIGGDAEVQGQQQGQGQKRSASVLSAGSRSSKASKRNKK